MAGNEVEASSLGISSADELPGRGFCRARATARSVSGLGNRQRNREAMS